MKAEFSNGARWGSTTDADEIHRAFAKWPKANVGIVTGAASGLFVVEADTPEGHDKDGIASLRALEAQYGPLPQTLVAESPSGSLHYYFCWPDGITIRNSTSKIGAGIDVRGEGGMVLAPPSIRPGKGTYRWRNEYPIATAPGWVIDLATANESDEPRVARDEPEADLAAVKAAVDVIPNSDEGWEDWNRIGMAVWRATSGTGFAAFDTWSQKSSKYDPQTTAAKWNEYFRSPPDRIGAGTLFRLADREHERLAQEACARAPCTRAELFALLGFEPEAAPETIPQVQFTLRQEAASPQTAPSPPTQAAPPPATKKPLIRRSEEFVTGFVPPDYLIEGLAQRRFIYSLTAPTGTGKTAVILRMAAHVDQGIPLGDREVERGRVLIFAGENPDDVCMRWIKLCEEMGIDPATSNVLFVPGVVKLRDKNIKLRISNEMVDHGPLALVIVETSAAFFEGINENDNKEIGDHARMMRELVNMEGGPTILVTSHPVKNASLDNLLPRGGGAFLNEVDGNFVLRPLTETMPKTVELTWHGKFRGPDFEPIPFSISAGTTELLKDSKGRKIWTVTAQPMSAAERSAAEDRGHMRQAQLMHVMLRLPGKGERELAEAVGWSYSNGEPNKSLARRVLKGMEAQKLAKVVGGRWTLTPAGVQAANTPEEF